MLAECTAFVKGVGREKFRDGDNVIVRRSGEDGAPALD